MNKMMRPLICVAVVITGSAAGAQQGTLPPQVPSLQRAPLEGPPLGSPLDILFVEPLEMGAPVLNAPYSATITTEVSQELRDGNRIERRFTSLVARDSRGRVRREQQLAGIGAFLPPGDVRMISISDPAAGVHYALDPERKVAMRSRPMVPGGGSVPDGTVIMRREGPEPGAATTSLGTRVIEGLTVEGTRTTIMLPAGAVGNQRPIEVVSERWYSPDLRVVVSSTRTDPRLGQTTYRLQNIDRSQPAPELFRVPAGYRIEDLKMFEVPAPLSEVRW